MQTWFVFVCMIVGTKGISSIMIIMIASYRSLIIITLGLTSLSTNITENQACVGEAVTFICTTSSLSLKWTVTPANSGIQPIIVSIRSTNSPGSSINVAENGFRLQFVIISYVSSPRNLTSAMYMIPASEPLHNAHIECSGSSVATLVFSIISGEYISIERQHSYIMTSLVAVKILLVVVVV